MTREPGSLGVVAKEGDPFRPMHLFSAEGSFKFEGDRSGPQIAHLTHSSPKIKGATRRGLGAGPPKLDPANLLYGHAGNGGGLKDESPQVENHSKARPLKTLPSSRLSLSRLGDGDQRPPPRKRGPNEVPSNQKSPEFQRVLARSKRDDRFIFAPSISRTLWKLEIKKLTRSGESKSLEKSFRSQAECS